MSDLEAWLAVLGLGAFHGINPGMGWLFAVALGLQERRRRAVLAALAPIALGHAISIALVVVAVAAMRGAADVDWLHWPIGLGLAGFGLYKLIRSRHPRWVGMRVGFRDLVAWSFLMATAHGAGLMLVPVLLGWDGGDGGHDHGDGGHDHGGHAAHASALSRVGRGAWIALLATGAHTLAYLAVMALAAVIIYEKVGLAILRTAWFNLDLVWALALIATGIATLLL